MEFTNLDFLKVLAIGFIYSIVENVVVILLIGGDKSTQERDIQKAKRILKEYLDGKS